MIRCVKTRNLIWVLEESKLFPELRNVVIEYHVNFDGHPVMNGHDLEGEDTESDVNENAV